MWEALLLNWDLYRDPILAALVAGGVLGLLGVYVVARRIVFVSAALSQVAAFGATLGFLLDGLLGITGVLHDALPFGLAIALCLAVVFLLSWLGDRPSLSRDALLGIAFVVPAALVFVVGPYIARELHEVEEILHGSAVLVRRADLYAVLGASALVLVTQIVAFRGFVFASLDPLVARTQGVPVRVLDALLFGSIALMTGLVTRALGAVPTFALTILPAIAVMSFRVGLRGIFVLSMLLGALSGGAGYLVAYAFDWSVGASQTLFAATLALLCRIVARLIHGPGS